MTLKLNPALSAIPYTFDCSTIGFQSSITAYGNHNDASSPGLEYAELLREYEPHSVCTTNCSESSPEHPIQAWLWKASRERLCLPVLLYAKLSKEMECLQSLGSRTFDHNCNGISCNLTLTAETKKECLPHMIPPVPSI
jgi:hypothetical protein